jgi:hypothetical protein
MEMAAGESDMALKKRTQRKAPREKQSDLGHRRRMERLDRRGAEFDKNLKRMQEVMRKLRKFMASVTKGKDPDPELAASLESFSRLTKSDRALLAKFGSKKRSRGT